MPGAIRGMPGHWAQGGPYGGHGVRGMAACVSAGVKTLALAYPLRLYFTRKGSFLNDDQAIIIDRRGSLNRQHLPLTLYLTLTVGLSMTLALSHYSPIPT